MLWVGIMQMRSTVTCSFPRLYNWALCAL